ncbi:MULTISPECIES: hypothetical protein [Micrococcaceae]|uniref:hypothetical protein n=1 Tax=unclassified Kocuria TaxID=2649579 RepID=UPI001010ECE1|nr:MULTISPECIES: hypothetical protein [unclassified Kocuria]
MNTTSRFNGGPRGSRANVTKRYVSDLTTYRSTSNRSVIISHGRRSVVSDGEAGQRLVNPELLHRLAGVREDLEASLARGEITQDQLEKFLARMESRLLEEQAASPTA